MDEHDKRAREVVDEAAKVQLRHGTPEAAAVIASALRSTAAVAAARSRSAALCDADATSCEAMAREAEREGDETGRATRVLLANFARSLAERIRDGAAPAPLASPAHAERDEYEVRFETVTDAHARGCRETQHRIAARLRARADEEQRRDVVALTDLDARIARAQARAVAAALRAEADALEVGT